MEEGEGGGGEEGSQSVQNQCPACQDWLTTNRQRVRADETCTDTADSHSEGLMHSSIIRQVRAITSSRLLTCLHQAVTGRSSRRRETSPDMSIKSPNCSQCHRRGLVIQTKQLEDALEKLVANLMKSSQEQVDNGIG